MTQNRIELILKCAAAGALAVAVSACANNGGEGPKSRPLAYGQTCGNIRAELRRMDSRGVPSKVERLNAGQSLSAKDRSEAERYNQLLNDYLAARCHV